LDPDPYRAVRQAFDAPWPGPRGEKIDLRCGALSATIYSEDGCRITSLMAHGFELLRQWNSNRRAFQYGCFPMVPWVGRLHAGVLRCAGKDYQLPVNKPPHALHGMACFAPWRTLAATKTSAEFELLLGAPWPRVGSVTQRIELVDESIKLTLSIKTAGDPFPAAGGWHPWFAKWIGETSYVAATPIGDADSQLQIAFPADWQEEPGPDELPTGRQIAVREGPWDDCFGFTDALQASLFWPGKIHLAMTSPAAYLVVFDKQPDATCVNPMSGPPDGVNTKPRLVSVDNPLLVSSVWTIKDTPVSLVS
jgi:aldose 1-epimerase